MDNKKMKICLYLEFYHFFGGILFKKIGTGLLSSYRNQKAIITELGIDFTEEWDDSCDILQINTPWIWSLYLIKKARAKNKKVIIWSHVTAEDIKGVFRFSSILSPLAKIYLTYTYNLADLILSPSEYTKSLLVGYGISASKIVAISNGVDTNKFSFSRERRDIVRAEQKLEGVVVGTVALAIPRKGISTFLYLSKLFPKNSFVWFGKIYSSFLVEAVPKDISTNVKFTGFVDDIVGSFCALDVFVFLSYEENQGMVILEAGSLGLPVLVRDIPVYTGWLLDGVNCLKAENDEEFQEKLSELLGDENLRLRLSSTLKSQIDKEHSISVVGKKLTELYASILTK